MFTDLPTIPAQLEVVLDVVYAMRQRKADTGALRQLIQPKGLKDLTASSAQLANHLSAARELDLVITDHDNNVRLNYAVRGKHQPRQAILAGFDRVALAHDRVEKWAGRFYSYLIVQDDDTIQSGSPAGALADRFMADLPSTVDKVNPMNDTKYRYLERWYVYAGMGWIDPEGAFTPDPTERLRRALPVIWAQNRKLDADQFMERVAQACPELDGGTLFCEATALALAYSSAARRCTHALAGALRRLHDEGDLILHCPADSRGWSLDKAGTSFVQGQKSNRFDAVERGEA
jgi:hypothetical protein